jgi:hypothetical protein
VLAEVPGHVAVLEHEPVRAARPDPDLVAAHARAAQGHVLAGDADADAGERVGGLALLRAAELARELDRDPVGGDLQHAVVLRVA